MNKKEVLKSIYKNKNINLEVKNRVLKFLLNKVAVVGLSNNDFEFETVLNNNKIFPNRYGRGYYSAVYEI